MSLSVIIPAYNEENRIKDSLITLISYLDKSKIKYEIILVDDGSTDKTAEVTHHVSSKIKILRNNSNYGKGGSVKKGIENARYDLILFTDADLATPITELEQMLSYISKGYDLVIASRNLPDSNIVVNQPFYRKILGKSFPILVRLLLLPGIKDTQCGFKLFKEGAAKNIIKLQTINRFAFDVELLYIARKLGFKVKEVPVNWIDKKGSKVNPLKDAYKMFIDLLRIKWNSLNRKYQ